MPDIDRILEAEQSILSIASELKKMRDAANILQGSQEQVDAVLKSAKKVIDVTEKFSNECSTIVAKLAATDINQRLDSLQTLHSELATAVDSIKKELRSAIGELQDKIQTTNGQLSTALKTFDERARSYFEQIATLVKEQTSSTNNIIVNIESKLGTLKNQLQVTSESTNKRQLFTIVVAILTLLSTLFLLSKALIPRLGG